MTNIAENIDNEYVLTAIIAIRENNKRHDSKAIRDYINKNFAAEKKTHTQRKFLFY